MQSHILDFILVIDGSSDVTSRTQPTLDLCQHINMLLFIPFIQLFAIFPLLQ